MQIQEKGGNPAGRWRPCESPTDVMVLLMIIYWRDDVIPLSLYQFSFTVSDFYLVYFFTVMPF